MSKKAKNARNELKKAYGDIFLSGSENVHKRVKTNAEVISVTPNLDLALNGGLREGSMVVMAGDPKCGKSTTALHIMKNMQALDRPIFYVDVENRLAGKNLKYINLEEGFELMRPDQKSLAAEDYLTAVEWWCKQPENKGGLCVVDSTSAMLCRKELDEELDGQTRSGLPKLLSMFTKRMSPILSMNDCILLMINHLIADTSPSRKTKIADCGRKVRYHADTLMNIAYTQDWKESEEVIGKELHWKIEGSSLGAAGTSCVTYLRFHDNDEDQCAIIDDTSELIAMGVDFSLIEKSGAWYTMTFMEDPDLKKMQGAPAVRGYLQENPEAYEKLAEKVKEYILA